VIFLSLKQLNFENYFVKLCKYSTIIRSLYFYILIKKLKLFLYLILYLFVRLLFDPKVNTSLHKLGFIQLAMLRDLTIEYEKI